VLDGGDPAKPLDFAKLAKADMELNVLDPMNIAGSLTSNQNPNSKDFLRFREMRVAGTGYHRSRVLLKLNEQPIYLGWTASAFGYAGRSKYQRALYPLKTYIQTMITDDMVAKKAGVLIEKVKSPGSIVSNLMDRLAAVKRTFVKLARTGNV